MYPAEPPSPEDPLFQLPNVVVTPHNAALTIETTDRMGLHAAMGIDEVLSRQAAHLAGGGAQGTEGVNRFRR